MPADGRRTRLGLLLWAERRQGDTAGAQDLLTAAARREIAGQFQVGSSFRWGAARGCAAWSSARERARVRMCAVRLTSLPGRGRDEERKPHRFPAAQRKQNLQQQGGSLGRNGACGASSLLCGRLLLHLNQAGLSHGPQAPADGINCCGAHKLGKGVVALLAGRQLGCGRQRGGGDTHKGAGQQEEGHSAGASNRERRRRDSRRCAGAQYRSACKSRRRGACGASACLV